MRTTCRRVLALVGLVVGVSSLAAVALPGFSDQNIASGNLNPTDTIMVQEIRITRGAGETVTLSSVTVQNIGTAGDGQIDKIIVKDGGTELGSTTNIAGLATGVTINLGGYNLIATTSYLKVFVVIGTSVSGGETVNLRTRVHYVVNGSSYTSAWITDLSPETIRNGGFDEIDDSSPASGYMNPGDEDSVQITVYTDNDANGSDVEWAGTGTFEIVRVENLGTAVKTNDVVQIRVMLTVSGENYIWDGDAGTGGLQEWGTWNPTSPMGFEYQRFLDEATELIHPPNIPDNGTLSVQVDMKIAGAGAVTDGRTIRTKTTVRVQERGQDSPDPAVRYDQSKTAGTTQTIRKQGFEEVADESESLGSGTAATGQVVIQTVRATDDDRNPDDVRAYRIYIRNMGTADGAEIDKIEVKAGALTLFSLDNSAAPHNGLPNFKTGAWYVFNVTPNIDVPDDDSELFKVYYTIGTPTDGHTLKPAVRIGAQEPPGSTDYISDEVTYPDTVALYLPGFEFVENVTPPEGGVAYSAQHLLAQRIRVEDLDEDSDNVTINPIVVKNLGTATSSDITKIEVYRQDTLGGEQLKLGETTDLAGLRTGGARIELTQDNIVNDEPGGAEIYLDIYLTIAEPEQMTANRTIQLSTRVLHTENTQSFDKTAVSNQWTLETNHRPVPDFTFEVEVEEVAVASIHPMADFTFEDTIQFLGTATDPDGDAISAWHWDFGDGNTADVQDPTHQYPNGGTFDVTLTVTDERGVTGSVTKEIAVEGPPNEPPTVDFTWSPQSPAENQAVTFTATVTDPDQPTATPFTYAWDFGDTTTSAAASPSHAFSEKKTYTVTLTVTDAQGATATATHSISVGNEQPVVTGITATPSAPDTGEEVRFTYTATDADDDAITGWAWDFGDNTTSSLESPRHVYAAPGTYTVSLVVTDERGGESNEFTTEVTVSGPEQVIVYAYPNPAVTQATVTYFLPEGGTDPLLRVYDLRGRLIREVALTEGESTYLWTLRNDDGDPIANGLYFCVVTASNANGRTVRSAVFRLLVAQ